ncbi:MAG: hypothetical protein U5L96_21160 [Owenweeksia sp.]|nr:hypothetical protein [Owenweeksia sp.]
MIDLNANYIEDGSSANSQLFADTSDAVFQYVGPSTIVDQYNQNMYPDVINGSGSGTEIVFYYNGNYSPASGAGIRHISNYKVVYLGIGLEMIQDAAVKNNIMAKSHAWFHGQISTEEFDFAAKVI